ncbi:MAG: type II toxin-antitoxin system prevent-host-death family antitoxin [Acidobacteriota bacterium]
MTVGIRELKNKLSMYLEKVKRGEALAVTERGKIIAYVLPSEKSPAYDELIRLVREERASWNGGKPAGPAQRVAARGKPVSEIVIEERR